MLWHGFAYRNTFAVGLGTYCGCRGTCSCQYFVCTEVIMKVVLIEKPKFLSAILRKIYGIKKETQSI